MPFLGSAFLMVTLSQTPMWSPNWLDTELTHMAKPPGVLGWGELSGYGGLGNDVENHARL